jgi:hypothetical protein
LDAFRLSPDGRAPEATDHWYGGVPPLAAKPPAYGCPANASGRTCVVIVSTDTGGVAGVTVTLADADLVPSAALVAVIVTVTELLVAGAVKRPEAEMLPWVAIHFTAVLLVLVTLAVNCFVPPAVTLAAEGDTDTLMVPLEASTVRVRVLLVSADLSRAVTVKVDEPCCLGVPETVPVVEFSVKPAGKVPDVTEKVYGVEPPDTESCPLYPTATVPVGRVAEI